MPATDDRAGAGALAGGTARIAWRQFHLKRRGAIKKNQIDVAAHNIMALEELACFADDPGNAPFLAQAAFELAKPLEMDVSDAETRVRRLIAKHKDEWMGFRASLAPNSWINSVCNVMRR